MPTRFLRLLPLLFVLSCTAIPGTAPPSSAPARVTAWPVYLRHDLYPEWIDANARVRWPPHDGCVSDPAPVTVPTGTEIDRFGGETGSFFSPKGESFAARAVPYVCRQMVYTVYRVARPLAVRSCKAAPWFGQPGGATQYQTTQPALKLTETGAIEVLRAVIPEDARAAPQCAGP